jgi:N-acylglucosamine 2-epimerase
MDFSRLSTQYQETLFRSIIPFWTEHSLDRVCGGYYNALTDTGDVFDTDKYIHLQAQQVWVFAWLYNRVDAVPDWLKIAQHGADFLLKNGREEEGRWLSTVDRRGKAVAPAENSVPDCFAAMAFAQLYQATGNQNYAAIAVETIAHILGHRQHQQSRLAADLGGFREFKHLSEPMMLLKALLEAQSLLSPDYFRESVDEVIYEIVNEFFDKRIGLLRENVLPEGSFSDSVLGRRLHPGLAFETVGYLLEAAEITRNRKLSQQALLMALSLADLGWDDINGGFFYYTDLKGRPSIYPEWDQKWMWVHVEALAIFTQGYLQVGQSSCLKWIRRIQEYTWQNFPDPNGKEWFGILDRKGQPIITCKATRNKGPYSLIKSIHNTWRAMESLGRQRPDPAARITRKLAP